MSDGESGKGARTWTPIILGILAIANTILISVISYLTTEIRTLRGDMNNRMVTMETKVDEARNFAIQYTDKMIELILKTGEKKK